MNVFNNTQTCIMPFMEGCRCGQRQGPMVPMEPQRWGVPHLVTKTLNFYKAWFAAGCKTADYLARPTNFIDIPFSITAVQVPKSSSLRVWLDSKKGIYLFLSCVMSKFLLFFNGWRSDARCSLVCRLANQQQLVSWTLRTKEPRWRWRWCEGWGCWANTVEETACSGSLPLAVIRLGAI